MKKAQSGFTLIELVMVIVILGILAAVAMPKFLNLSTDATTAKNAAIAGAKAEHNAARAACLTLPGGDDTKCGTLDGITQ